MDGPVAAGPSACFHDFDRRLDGAGPLGVAVSGGGDSVALLYALKQWDKRPLEVFCVDHGLNPLSSAWTASVARHAEAVGAGFTALHWKGDKPKTGLSAAARTARHRLLAEAARRKGIHVLCLGHTRDDIAEASLMRAQGSSVGTPRSWAPSPAWPEGRGVFIYRPFLDLRREALRGFLRGVGVTWIEDPANESPYSLRARVRRTLDGDLDPVVDAPPLLTPSEAEALLDMTYAPYGMIAFRAGAFAALPYEKAGKLLSAAVVCCGGGSRLPRSDSLDHLLANLKAGNTSTLCGARIRRAGDRIEILREAGDIGRRGAGPMRVDAGQATVWDGRFAIVAESAGHISTSLTASYLGEAGRRALAAMPAGLRRSQPIWSDGDTSILAANAALRQTSYNPVQARCWVGPRFLAAAGLYVRESDIVLPPDGAWL